MLAHLAEDPDMDMVGAFERFVNQFQRTESNEEFLNNLPGMAASRNGF
jgi:hypothetical protein